MFGEFGEVKDCYLPKDHYTGQSRGFGFIRFATEEEAEAAIKARVFTHPSKSRSKSRSKPRSKSRTHLIPTTPQRPHLADSSHAMFPPISGL